VNDETGLHKSRRPHHGRHPNPNARMRGYFSIAELELNPRRLALLKRLVGDETWHRSRGFKEVSWSDVETNVDEVFSASQKARHGESSVPKPPRRKARVPRQD
jgi:hypothetical protein